MLDRPLADGRGAFPGNTPMLSVSRLEQLQVSADQAALEGIN